MESGDPLVSADWLKANIASPDIRVVDATWFAPFLDPEETGFEAYNRGHIPGAVFFDIDDIADENSSLPHMLPDAVVFSSRIRKLGIGDGNRVIVYDRNNFFASARAWWMLRVMGHNDVHVLDGGLAAWQAAGGELEDLPPVAVDRHFTPRVRADLAVDVEQVIDAIIDDDTRIIDARPAGRFTGDAPEPRPELKSGHIPGSVSIPGGELVNADGTLKSKNDLAEIFGDLPDRIITSCGSGVTAAITALALARIGHWDVAVYDGSWSEWASDPARPIETGAA